MLDETLNERHRKAFENLPAKMNERPDCELAAPKQPFPYPPECDTGDRQSIS